MALRLITAAAACGIVLSSSGPVQAQTITDGHSLLQRCSDFHVISPMAGLHCRGYIGATVDIMADGNEVAGFRACPSQPHEREQIVKAVKRWLAAHEPELAAKAHMLAARALAETYPCTDSDATSPVPADK